MALLNPEGSGDLLPLAGGARFRVVAEGTGKKSSLELLGAQCVFGAEAVRHARSRVIEGPGGLPAVQHAVFRFGSAAAAKEFMREYHGAAGECDPVPIDISFGEPIEGLGRQTTTRTEGGRGMFTYITSQRALTRYGRVVHGVRFLPDRQRAELAKTDPRFERVVRAADRRVRRGLDLSR